MTCNYLRVSAPRDLPADRVSRHFIIVDCGLRRVLNFLRAKHQGDICNHFKYYKYDFSITTMMIPMKIIQSVLLHRARACGCHDAHAQLSKNIPSSTLACVRRRHMSDVLVRVAGAVGVYSWPSRETGGRVCLGWAARTRWS